MPTKAYTHSIYWLAKRQAARARRPPARTLTEALLSDCMDPGAAYGHHTSYGRSGATATVIAPLAMPAVIAFTLTYDIGVAAAGLAKRLADPEERMLMAAELRRNLRILRRPLYYARETERRRRLSAERRKLRRRTTTAPMPTPEGLLELWNRRKESKADMIRLGGMLQDLECYVDNCLRIDGDGKVVGRNGGIRGWLAENLPELSAHYKTLMRYKAMAIRLRQATGTKDPKPTSALLDETPRYEVVDEILEDFRTTFSSLEETLAWRLDAELVFLKEKRDHSRKRAGPQRE